LSGSFACERDQTKHLKSASCSFCFIDHDPSLEILELRRLPVSQGGFQVEAKPINSVFKDRRRSRSGSLSTLSTQGSLMHANGNASALKSFR